MSYHTKAEEAVTRALEDIVPVGTDISGECYLSDLGIDSFTVIELAMELEDQLNLYIDDSSACKCDSVKDLINFIAAELERQQ